MTELTDSLAALRELTVTAISDALDTLGVDGGCRGLRTLAPGRRCLGPAYTVRFVPVGPGEVGPAADYIDDVPAGAVIVLDNGGRTHCTVWGDILTACAVARGVAGTVIHGACRDSTGIRAQDYPLFSLASFMKSGKNRVRMDARQVPVEIGGTTVQPGDVLACDDDGVLAIPAARVAEVAEVARQITAMEERVVAAVAAGTPLREARRANQYDRFAWRGRAVTEPAADGAAEAGVRAALDEVLPPGLAARIPRDAPLRAAGLDSLRTVELVSALEARLGLQLVEDDLRDEYFASVAGLVSLVAAKRAAAPPAPGAGA